MRRFGGRRLFSTYGAHHRRVAADLEQHSSNDPASLAQRALLLSTDYRLHEASEVLQQLGDTESDAMIRDEIRKIEAQMADALSAGASFAPPRTIHFPVPESVFVSESSGLGLFAARDFDVGEVVFVESPIGVASDTGDACSNCLKPLGARHVLRSDGSVAKEFRSEHVETLFAGCGLEKLEPMEGCCSKKCCEAMRLKGVVKKKKSRKNLDSTTLLLQNLSPSERQAVTRNLLMCADGAAEVITFDHSRRVFPVLQQIPENLSLDEASAWSAVRKNAIEVVTSSLAVMAGPSGFEPVVDPNKEPSTGSGSGKIENNSILLNS
jgi:hypothetical protein